MSAPIDDTYDGILLGSGHNCLVLQAYLSRCGLKTVCVEQSQVAGGGLRTVEDPRFPGYRHNTHAFFLRGITAMPWFTDLELAQRNVRFLEPDLNVTMLTRGGGALSWWTDIDKTIESFRQYSEKDAESLKQWHDEFVPIVEKIVRVEAQSPPLPPEQRHAVLSRSAEGRRLLEVSALSPLEFVERYFENDVIRAGLLFFNGLREVDLRAHGFGYSIPTLLASRHKAQMCVGGSAALARGLLEDIADHGGRLLLGTHIRRIVVEGGRAIGVETGAGDLLRARGFVVSGLNPNQTFLDLVGRDDLPAGVADAASRFRYNLLAPLFSLNLALEEPPEYRAAERHPEISKAFMVILGLDRFEQFGEIVDAHEAGRVPSTVMWGCSPTVFDPSQAPTGKHTAFMWEKLPYKLDGDAANWDGAKRQHGSRLLDLWADYAPNLSRGAVRDWFCRSPLDTERTLPNMRYGDLLVGSLGDGQVGYHRPFAGAGEYRTPLPGLYLCGGSTHPGGNVTGLCGYNAARVLAADLNIKPWWTAPSLAVE